MKRQAEHQRVAVVEMGSEREGLQHVALRCRCRLADRPRRCRPRPASEAPASPARCAGRLRTPASPSPMLRFSPSGNSMEKGAATLPTRLIKASIVLAADDIVLFPGFRRRLGPCASRTTQYLVDFASETSRLKWAAVAELPLMPLSSRRFDQSGSRECISSRPMCSVWLRLRLPFA